MSFSLLVCALCWSPLALTTPMCSPLLPNFTMDAFTVSSDLYSKSDINWSSENWEATLNIQNMIHHGTSNYCRKTCSAHISAEIASANENRGSSKSKNSIPSSPRIKGTWWNNVQNQSTAIPSVQGLTHAASCSVTSWQESQTVWQNCAQ